MCCDSSSLWWHSTFLNARQYLVCGGLGCHICVDFQPPVLLVTPRWCVVGSGNVELGSVGFLFGS